ncbi:RteC domain-containing protein [Elizabethkingia anophelis]|uniref:RteC domain-containing protein n=1 Tax=Elizabethkingia anophelis TaxID=1117645 RepID=UPI00136B411D|nr:RteC domain-containing protein [Elizabethkingia anophelis]
MNIYFRTVITNIKEEEQRITMHPNHIVQSSRHMVVILTDHIRIMRERVSAHNFPNQESEIEFFKEIKPLIYGKLLFYNRVLRIESGRPIDLGNAIKKYFSKKVQKLECQYRKRMRDSEFYRYYRSGSTEKDSEYFIRGNLIITHGAKRQAIDVDPTFSTFYDYKIAEIIESDLFYEYLHFRINDYETIGSQLSGISPAKIAWTDSKNALIELIYALHASQSLSHGKMEIRKLVYLFQTVFNVQLGDVHHAFHRMKYRSGERSTFLNKLKESLEKYMDKNL